MKYSYFLNVFCIRITNTNVETLYICEGNTIRCISLVNLPIGCTCQDKQYNITPIIGLVMYVAHT